jgi:hypothetical protein
VRQSEGSVAGRRFRGRVKVQWPGGGSVVLGAMVQRVRALWFSAYCAASSVARWGPAISM